MELKELAKLKDEILKVLLKHKNGADHVYFYTKFNKYGLSQTNFIDIIKEIENYSKAKPLIKIIKGQTYHAIRTVYTIDFLSKGGFVNRYENELKAIKDVDRVASQDQTIKNLQEQNLRQKIKTHWIPIIVSILGLIISTIALHKTSDNVGQEQLAKEIKVVQDNIEQLEDGLKNENENLKEKLYKAEMLISVYEDSVK